MFYSFIFNLKCCQIHFYFPYFMFDKLNANYPIFLLKY